MSKAARRLDRWSEAQELDRVAVPLIGEYGVERAYEMALEELEGSDVRD